MQPVRLNLTAKNDWLQGSGRKGYLPARIGIFFGALSAEIGCADGRRGQRTRVASGLAVGFPATNWISKFAVTDFTKSFSVPNQSGKMSTSSWQAAQLQLDELTHLPVIGYRSISGAPIHVAEIHPPIGCWYKCRQELSTNGGLAYVQRGGS